MLVYRIPCTMIFGTLFFYIVQCMDCLCFTQLCFEFSIHDIRCSNFFMAYLFISDVYVPCILCMVLIFFTCHKVSMHTQD